MRCNDCIYSCPLKAVKRENEHSIDTNLCNERPKLLQKLPAKFNLAIFRLRFCAVGIISSEIGANVCMRTSKCKSSSGKKAKQIEICAAAADRSNARVLCDGINSVKKTENMSMNESNREKEKKKREKNHCVAANRSTFDSIIISKITLVKSNFSIEKVHNSLVVRFFSLYLALSLAYSCVNTFVRQVVIQLAYFIRFSEFL